MPRVTPAVDAAATGVRVAADRPGWSRRAAWAAGGLILAGVLLHAGALRWGFMYDDYPHQFVLRGLAAATPLSRWDLYDFGPQPGSAGLAPWRIDIWWADPDFKVRFFRPVTSASLVLDHALYGAWAPGYHLTSLLLFGALLLLVLRLCRRLGLTAAASLWGLAFVALDDVHTLPVEWIASRNTLLAALFSVATVLAAERCERTRRRWALLPVAVLFALACGSKESGLAAVGLVVLHRLVSPPPAARSLTARLRHAARCPAVRLLAALAAAYLGYYVAAGYGARSDVYPTPWADGRAYLARLAALLPLGTAGLALGVPLDLVAAQPALLWGAAAAAALVCVVLGLAYARVAGFPPAAQFGAGWILICLLVESGGELSVRLLSGAGIGAGLLYGLLLDALRPRLRPGAVRQRGRLALAAVLLAAGPAAGVWGALLTGRLLAGLAAHDHQAIVAAPLGGAPSAPRDVLLLNTPSELLGLTFAPTWNVHRRSAATFVLPLQLGGRGLRLTRLDDRTMLLTSTGTPLATGRIERIFRYRRAPRVGDTFAARGLRVRVVAVDAGGVRTARLEFDRPPEDAAYTWLAFRAGGFERVNPPPVPESLELPEVPRATWYAP